ncbi:MAG: LysR substrate-binding domain-containing protein [Pseudomonadota bacterium]
MFQASIPDLRGLRTLKAIQETGSLAEAAARLHLTPSALSHQLREIETATGLPVLLRKTRPPQFTPAGERLLALADQVLAACREAERDLGRLRSGVAGRLVLAIECHSCFDWLMPVIGDFRQHWPDVAIDFRGGMHDDAQQALAAGELDLVVTSDPEPRPGLAALPLFEYESLLLVAPEHPLAGRAFVRPQDLAGETLVTYPVAEPRLDVFRTFLTPAGVRPAKVRHADVTQLVVQLVASGHGVAALPNWVAEEYLARGWVRAVHLGGDGAWCTLYAALRETDLELAYVQDFVGTARDRCFENLRGIRAVRRS